jgi:tetratricopeptide (TPR) repeat protein
MTTDDLSALTKLGAAQVAGGDHAAALATYERSLALDSRQPQILNNRGFSLIELGRAEEAVESLDRALALWPGSAAILNNRGNALRALGRVADALASYDAALVADPGFVEALDNRALVLIETGRLDEAVAQLERAIRLHPGAPCFYLRLTELKRLERDDPHLRAMQALAAAPNDLTTSERIDLHFALGRALADTGDFDQAFAHLREANALKRLTLDFDLETMLAAIAATPAAFTRGLLEARAGLGDLSDLPVFVVGMPRSGSTLVEQIIASHPAAFGAGETGLLQASINALRSADEPASATLDEDALWASRTRRMAEGYLGPLRRLARPGAARVVDKTLENYRLIGQIRLALPNARIIHVRRDPLDTCVSCFSRPFVNVPYSYDLTDLGRMYRAYAGLMDHWRRVTPQSVLLEVRYEELVSDLEGQARRIVAHCGLAWDARCLLFHETLRPVLTASAAQVRRPIYGDAIGRWRAYEAHLSPLIEALGPALDA